MGREISQKFARALSFQFVPFREASVAPKYFNNDAFLPKQIEELKWIPHTLYALQTNIYLTLSALEEAECIYLRASHYLHVENYLKKAWEHFLKAVKILWRISNLKNKKLDKRICACLCGLFDIAWKVGNREIGETIKKKVKKLFEREMPWNREKFLEFYYLCAKYDIPKWEYGEETINWRRILENMAMRKECNYGRCKRKDVRLGMCKTCRGVFYCSRRHQKKDWSARHRHECFPDVDRSSFV